MPSATTRAPVDAGRHRFFVAEPPAGDAAMLHDEAAHRMTRVLRLRAGDAVELFDGSGRSWSAVIAMQQARTVRLELRGTTDHAPEPRTVLCAALIRLNRFEWLVEKATELGASVIQPVITAHTAVRADEIGRARLERWRRIAVEAAEQCGRYAVPEIREPVPLDRAVADVDGRLIFAAEPAHGRAPSLGGVLGAVGDGPVTLLSGPEGGFTREEVGDVLNAGGVAVSLGPLVLRAETAAVACLVILLDARQGLAAPKSPSPPSSPA